MEKELMRYVITQGIFAVLFVYLLYYVLQENSKRESNYQNIISDLTKRFNILENVNAKVDKIEEKLK